MITILKCFGLLIAGLVISKICVSLLELNNYNKSIIDKESKNIVYCARELADYLCLMDEDHISYFEYNTTFYEELFFLLCIEAVKLLNNKIDNKLYDKIKLKTFKYTNNLDGIKKYDIVKNIIDDTFKQHSMFYMSLINTCNYHLNNDFYSAVIDYQVSIFTMNYKNNPAIKEKIKNILQDILPRFNKFYNDYI